MDKILQKTQQEICKDILKIIDNESVNIEIEENTKNSAYVFLNNTMYITNNTNNKKTSEEQNKSKVLVIAHECAHSIQSKALHITNFLIANLELILFCIILIARVFFQKYDILVNSYVIISLFSIAVRWYLEVNATINSVRITTKYMLEKDISKGNMNKLTTYYKKELLKNLPLFLAWLFLFKIIRLIIVIAIL